MGRVVKIFTQLFLFVVPWFVRRACLNQFHGYEISPEGRIGFSVILAKRVIIKGGARIGHLNFINAIDELRLESNAKIGRSNWITGANSDSRMFKNDERRCELVLDEHARITGNHHLDCTGGLYVGAFTTVAGIGSQMLTHGIDIGDSVQTCAPVHIGKFCFVGSGSIVLKGAVLPDYCVLAAGAVLNKKYEEKYCVYGGVPARHLKEIDRSAKYFSRTHGHVQ